MDHARPSSRRRVYGDLRQLADELQLGDFSALSAGIGIGNAVARERFSAPPRPLAVARLPLAADSMPQTAFSSAPPAVSRKPQAASRQRPTAHGPRLPFEMKLVAWATDLLFVALAVATALALAALLAAMRGGDAPLTLDEWLAVRPVQWLAGLSVYAAVGGLYGIYGAYMLLFKLVAGRTLGESLFWRFSLVRKGRHVGQST